MPQSDEYPKEIVTTEKATEASEEKQVVTVVSNEYKEKAVEAAIAYMNAFNEIQSIESKVHIKVMFSRYCTDGSKIGTYTYI